jgi:hypothetical protein
VEKNFIYLQEINSFFEEVMPPKNKKVWEILKRSGW